MFISSLPDREWNEYPYKLNQGSLQAARRKHQPWTTVIPSEETDSQLVNDTLMPDHGKQSTGNGSGGDDSEDGKLEQGRGVCDGLFRYVGYRVGDGHCGRVSVGSDCYCAAVTRLDALCPVFTFTFTFTVSCCLVQRSSPL